MRNVILRLRSHLDERRPSLLGELIKVNHPRSKTWQVDLYTLADCVSYVDQMALFPIQDGLPYDSITAEKGMIWRMRPVVNREHNPRPTPLPEVYEGHHILREEPLTYYGAQWFTQAILNGWTYAEDHDRGRGEWWHHSGVTLTSEDMVRHIQAGSLPDLPKPDST